MKKRSQVVHLFPYAAWLFLAMGALYAADIINSWKPVYDDLSLQGKVLESPFQDFWTNSVVLRGLVAERNTNALLELAGQSGPGTARLSVYFALRSVDRKSALNVGLEIGLTTSVIANPLVIHVMEAVAADLSRAESTPILTQAFSTIPIQPSNAKMLISALPEKILRDWFEDEQRPPSFLTYEALVLDRLLLELGKRSEKPSPRMTNALEQYVLIPGIPRMVFVLDGNERHPLFKQATRLSLEDETLSNDTLIPFVEAFAGFIVDNIDPKSLRASKERYQVITNVLANVRRVEFPRKLPNSN